MNELVVVSVINQTGMYQVSLVTMAQSAARELGFDLMVVSADAEPTRPATEVQKDQLFDLAFQRGIFEGKHVRALLVAAAGVGVHTNRPVVEVLSRGIDVITLNTVVPDADQLRKKYPDRILAYVGPDQREAGRIQGDQLKRFLPQGGFCLYITGPTAAWAPRERRQGLEEVVGHVGSGHLFDFSVIEGDWTATKAHSQVKSWLTTAGSGKQLSAIVCQSDPMAMGAQEALKAFADDHHRPDLLTIPILGIDGCEGKESADQGRISATIIMAPCTKEAMELLARTGRGESVSDIKIPPKPYEPAGIARTLLKAT